MAKFFLFLFLAISAVFFCAAAAFAQTKIEVNFPGATTPPSDPAQFIIAFYKYALSIGGVLAFGVIVWGGIRYTFAAGNPSGQTEGKEWIKAALWGLALLVSIFLLLNTVNPELTKLVLPELQSVKVTTSPSTDVDGGGPTSGTLGCPTCTSLSTTGIVCTNSNSCTADPRELAVLQCIVRQSGQTLKITEGYPATGNHQSLCHRNGCCVDLTPSSAQDATCVQVQAIVQAARACGAPRVANEYPSCGGQTFTNTTGNNIHVQGC